MAQFKNIPFETHPDHGGKVLQYQVKYDDGTSDVWYESMSGASSNWPENRLYTDIDFSKSFCLTHVGTHKKADFAPVTTARTFERSMAWTKVDKTQLKQSGDNTFKVFVADANGKATDNFKGTMQLQESGARLAFHRMAKSVPAGLADTAEESLYFQKVDSLSIDLKSDHSWYEATDHKV